MSRLAVWSFKHTLCYKLMKFFYVDICDIVAVTVSIRYNNFHSADPVATRDFDGAKCREVVRWCGRLRNPHQCTFTHIANTHRRNYYSMCDGNWSLWWFCSTEFYCQLDEVSWTVCRSTSVTVLSLVLNSPFDLSCKSRQYMTWPAPCYCYCYCYRHHHFQVKTVLIPVCK